jgi:uncharacterized protein YbaR (Trm112 family)
MDKRHMHDICPECEMPLEVVKHKECPYCGTVLIDTVLDLDEEEHEASAEDLDDDQPRQAD